MAGYANRVLTLPFPEFTEDGDQTVHVTIRNPKTLPLATLDADLPENLPDGTPDPNHGIKTTYEVVSRLIIGWHAYDATSDDDDQPPLPLPATPELVAKLPMEILMAVGEKINEVKGAGA
ncbi:hypothetical protein [Peterkaempfera griseoplana]|uniref:hypothetical protein n=1 Tax=Peterkaempfera griseoplana TaxID=66896 RepID=UPI0006E2C52E|nr:hypothetical protein [Peterkaempfera griseoplana]